VTDQLYEFQWFDKNGDPEGPPERFTQENNAGRLPGYVRTALNRSDVKSIEFILQNDRSMVWSKVADDD
jgi:hypothetical protein